MERAVCSFEEARGVFSRQAFFYFQKVLIGFTGLCSSLCFLSCILRIHGLRSLLKAISLNIWSESCLWIMSTNQELFFLWVLLLCVFNWDMTKKGSKWSFLIAFNQEMFWIFYWTMPEVINKLSHIYIFFWANTWLMDKLLQVLCNVHRLHERSGSAWKRGIPSIIVIKREIIGFLLTSLIVTIIYGIIIRDLLL